MNKVMILPILQMGKVVSFNDLLKFTVCLVILVTQELEYCLMCCKTLQSCSQVIKMLTSKCV